MKLICERGQRYEYRHPETGECFFSVSQVRDVMWDGLRRVPYDTLEAARVRGELLHIYFSLKLGALRGICEAPEHLPQYRGYCLAIDTFMAEKRPWPVSVETSSFNRKLGVAGTRDADLRFPDTRPGKFDIVDLKTGEETPTDPIQIITYSKMEGCELCDRLFDLYVRADGTYELRPINPIKHLADEACFMNALQVLKWRAGR